MMKRILACLVAIACLMTAVATFALAETMTMRVIKVKEAVNLREGPSTDTNSVGLVPLGTELTGCEKVEGSDWIRVTYQGAVGYIRGDFLELVAVEPEATPEPAPEAPEAPEASEGGEVVEPAEEAAVEVYVPWADRELAIEAPVKGINDASAFNDDYTILDVDVAGVHVTARQIFTNANEYLLVVGMDANGNELWRRETATDDISEMTQTDAFIGGTAEAPLVLMYNDWHGLSAQDPVTGETRWEVTKEQVFLGGSISHVEASSGIVYIGGYYGPDPVAIDANGNVLWQASSGDLNATWMYNMELRDNGIACYYNQLGDGAGVVIYDFNGQVVGTESV